MRLTYNFPPLIKLIFCNVQDTDTFPIHAEEAGCNGLEEQENTGIEADLQRDLEEISRQSQKLFASGGHQYDCYNSKPA